MNRSISLFLVALVSAAPFAYAQDNLDSLLGDWADAASNEVSQSSNSDSDLLLAPATATEGLATLELMDDEPEDEPTGSFQANAPAAELEKPVRMPETDGSTLTGTHGSESLTHGHSVVHPAPDPDIYSIGIPTSNPHYASGDCGCQSKACDGQCGSKCGGSSTCGGGCELIEHCETGCRQGMSECRPHQPPNLPSSTFLDLFRSRNSYSNVWAGYAEETRLRLRNRSPHLDGTWKCQGCGAMLEPNQVGCSCGSSCDTCQ